MFKAIPVVISEIGGVPTIPHLRLREAEELWNPRAFLAFLMVLASVFASWRQPKTALVEKAARGRCNMAVQKGMERLLVWV